MNIIRYGAVALMVTATVSGQARPAFEVIDRLVKKPE